jgi:hypothetical protein
MLDLCKQVVLMTYSAKAVIFQFRLYFENCIHPEQFFRRLHVSWIGRPMMSRH